MGFTEDQLKAIGSRNENLLVSAAAGSGKTTVLVERVMKLITDEDDPCDIGEILVVTFTRAAAANMKNRIAEAFRERIKEKGSDPRLLRQSILVRSAKIMTIDSFCNSLVKEHFPETGLDPGFRIASEGEEELIKKDVFANVMEEMYLSEDNQDFLEMCEALSSGQDDSRVEDQVIRIWNAAESHPWPEEWLETHRSDYDGIGRDVIEFCAGGIRAFIRQAESMLLSAAALCDEPSGPAKYRDSILDTLGSLRNLLIKTEETEMITQEDLRSVVFGRIPSIRKDEGVSEELKKRAQKLRNDAKKLLTGPGTSASGLLLSLEEEEEAGAVCSRHLHSLMDLVLRVREAYAAEKERRGIVDFSDMEHMALRLLVKSEKEKDEPSDIALRYRKTFREVMCDEYQDSNLVQEQILSLIAGDDPGECRRFMVGDVKQSIYSFRQARPEIFVQKYEEYGENLSGTDMRVILAENFRSRPSVTDSVNRVFEVIMKKGFGGVEYDENAMLRASAAYPSEDGPENGTELLIAADEQPEKEGASSAPRTGEEEEQGGFEKESRMIARKIRELMNSLRVCDGKLKAMRPVSYGDMAILMRSQGEHLSTLRRVLEENGIPVSVTTSSGYFSALEVRTLLNFLETVSNPLNDIPLFGTMRGLLGDFSDEELALIKAGSEGTLSSDDGEGDAGLKEKGSAAPEYDRITLWDRVRLIAEGEEKSPLQEKALSFVNRILRYRELSRYTGVSGMIRTVLQETGYRDLVSAMSGGARRLQNVQALLGKAEEYEKTSYSGVHDFVRYINELKKYSIDFGEADTEGEDSDAVRIMTIHKSKGLEFPVVFLSFTGKQFNDQNLKSLVVVSPDHGIGLSRVDTSLRLSSPTLRKEYVISKIRETTHGEELRLLYTAMTRAKEKLVITGYAKDPEKLKQDAEGTGDILHTVMAQKSYLNWLMLTPLADVAKFISTGDTTQNEEEIRKSLAEKRAAVLSGREADRVIYEKTMAALKYAYPHPELGGVYSKTTVTKLKRLALSEEGDSVLTAFPKEYAEEPETGAKGDFAGAKPAAGGKIPNFMIEGERTVSGTFRGTAYHRVLAVMDLNAGDVNEELLRLEREGLISPAQRKAVKPRDIERFMDSSVFERMKKAYNERRLWREQPFVSSAESVIGSIPGGSTVILQGIIDAMWEEDDGTVILDYKSDRVADMDELKERYASQLEIYGKAMNRRKGRPGVKSLILYSLPLALTAEV